MLKLPSCSTTSSTNKKGVNMSSTLGPVLVNLVMTELKDVIIKPLIADGTVRVYSHFVYDTLLVMKAGNVSHVHNSLNKLAKNLRYTVDIVQDKVPHFRPHFRP